MRGIISFLVALLPSIAFSQISIGGHIAPYDSLTGTWLATIPQDMFGQDCCLSINLNESYNQIVIGNDTLLTTIGNQHLFQKVCADSIYFISITDTTGNVTKGHLQFTFLPLIMLEGTFGYDYQEGSITIANPELGEDSIYHAKVKWRGGTTNGVNKHKRNYKVKIDHDVKLFGMRSDNNWMLDAGQPDVFRMRNRIAMDLWNDMAHKPYYTDQEPNARNGVSGRMVEVFLNNEYRGIYNLSELIDRKQLKLKKIDKNTGTIHGCLYKGVSWNHTQMFDYIDNYNNFSETLFGIEAKYPDLNDSDTIEWTPYVEANNFVLTCNDEDFEEFVANYFDIPVLLDYSIFVSVTNAVDNSGKNMYWAIYDKESTKRLTPTPWDLDATFGQRWGELLTGGDNDHSLPSYMTDVDVCIFFRLYKNNALQFNNQLNERYLELRSENGILSSDSLISRFTHYYQTIKKSGAAFREKEKWNGDSDIWNDTIDFDEEYNYICNWIKDHMDILDYTLFPVYYNKNFFNELSIRKTNDTQLESKEIFDLKGRKMGNSGLIYHKLKRGIYIQGGKKVIIAY